MREAVLAAAEEAAQLYRDLAAADPGAFVPDLARALGGHGEALLRAQRPRDGAECFHEGAARLRPLAEAEPAAFTGGVRTVAKPLEQANLVLLLPAVGVHDPDYFTLRLLAEILGGGMASRLFQEAREKRGLAYAIDAYSETYADTGVLGVFAGCAATDAEELARVTAGELVELLKPVQESELARAKAQLKGSMFMGREGALARAEQAAGQVLLFGETLDPGRVAAEVDAVTPDQLAALTQRILAQRTAAVAVLGPKAALKAADTFQRLVGR